MNYYLPQAADMQTTELVQAGLAGTLTYEQFCRQTFTYRENYTRQVSWAVYTVEYMDALAKLVAGRQVLEVAAGRGILGLHMPPRTGAPWICTDANPPLGADHVVKLSSGNAIKRYHPEVLFVSWVPYRARWDKKLASQGLPVIFVGEGAGGCTGSTAFWKENAAYEIVDNVCTPDVPNWYGIHDCTYLTRPRN